MAAKFQGFPVEAFEFYDALTAENTKAWWTAHKSDYDTLVRTPKASARWYQQAIAAHGGQSD